MTRISPIYQLVISIIYYSVLTEKEYSNGTLKNVIAKYFNNSYLGVVSTLIKEEDISVDDLRKLIDDVEQGNRK